MGVTQPSPNLKQGSILGELEAKRAVGVMVMGLSSEKSRWPSC